MIVTRMQAGGKGIQPLQAMRQPVLDQKFKRAIGHGRLTAKAFVGQPAQNLIRAHGPVRFQQNFQRPSTHGRQTRAIRLKPRFGLIKGARGAGVVVMRGKGIGRRCRSVCVIQEGYFITFQLTCYHIT